MVDWLGEESEVISSLRRVERGHAPWISPRTVCDLDMILVRQRFFIDVGRPARGVLKVEA